MRKITLVWLLLLTLTACARQSGPPVLMMSTPILTVRAVPTYIETPTAVPSSMENHKTIPSQTFEEVITPTDASTRTEIPTESTPTPPPPNSEIVSPDGKFVARLYDGFNHPSGKQTIEIRGANGLLMWTVPYQGAMPTGDPHPNLSLSQWAADSTVLYFYYSWAYDGWWTIFDGSDLQSIDIKTGKVTTVISGGCIAFAFSPDRSQLAYTRSKRITVRDLTTGSERIAEIESEAIQQAGQIRWSPSGKALVFHVLADDLGNALMIYLDAETMKQRKLLNYFTEDYPFDGWTETENPRYRKPDHTIIVVDIRTGVESMIGTATPRP